MIIILDCGSQLTLNIARRIREMNVFCEIYPYNHPIEDTEGVEGLRSKNPEGIIISGGPNDVNAKGSPLCDKAVFDLGVPVLGICYGMQTMAKLLGGEVASAKIREYGKAELNITSTTSSLLNGIEQDSIVWMSHGDTVVKLPEGFVNTARSSGIVNAAMENPEKKLAAVQFHPEVDHTVEGKKVLSNFLDICGCKRDWKMENFIENTIKEIRETVGEGIVIGGVSGGVDSTVGAAILYKAIGDRFRPILVNNGLVRMNECEEVIAKFKENFGHEPIYEDASDLFLEELKGVADPEKKRKIIGKLFIDVFAKVAREQSDAEFLMQGTLYPDVIESQSAFGGPSSTIKSHHNVGGLPDDLKFKLIEPFRFLFKDEVRKIGEILGLDKETVWRHPFPGPGLAVRVLGEITPDKLEILRKADRIYIQELLETGEYYNIWQAFAVLLPVKSVGVMGDERSYEYTIALRAVTSNDGMTANWAKVPYDVLEKISGRIINEVKGINRVVFDISQKPPATIEWE